MKSNFLLGSGEKLMEKIVLTGNPSEKIHPYSITEAKERLIPLMEAFESRISELPEDAFPLGRAVAMVTIHPTYLAKSYYPSDFFDHSFVKSIGSRERILTPKTPSPKIAQGTKEFACEHFVSGNKANLLSIHSIVESWNENSNQANDLRKVEDFRYLEGIDRIRLSESYNGEKKTTWEVVLHANPFDREILALFEEFVSKRSGKVDLNRRMHSGGLCFLPIVADYKSMQDIADFSLLRVSRVIPKLRPVYRDYASPLAFNCMIPNVPAIDQNIRAAIFDGGSVGGLEHWVTNFDATNGSNAPDDFREHSLGVTSAALFGPIREKVELPRPFCNVDVVTVIDEMTGVDSDGEPDYEYFDVLSRISNILDTKKYDFVNLSLGPDWPVEDDEPHAWTSVLDKKFYEQNTLAFCAAGNSGEKDWESGNARVQPPSDGVNITAVGSCDSIREKWKRSAHSSIGPGRLPGVIRPDFLAMGGCKEQPFFVLGPASGTAVPVLGTSFASPTAMRIATGVKALLGNSMGPMAIKALLINKADPGSQENLIEVGWGRICHDVEDLIKSDDSTVHIIYQRELSPGECIRAHIPLPEQKIEGNICISMTCCYLTDTDPEHPVNYTKAGLTIKFRPHENRFETYTDEKTGEKKEGNLPKTSTFMTPSKMYGESEFNRRKDLHKWETVLHSRKRTYRASSLENPVFDIHYMAREGGGAARESRKITLGMVITLESKREKNLFNKVFTRYKNILEPLVPVTVPVQVRT